VATTLEQALEELRAMPADAQDAIARDLLDLIRSERKWDQLFADPRSEAVLKQLAGEADEEAAHGRDFDFDPSTRPGVKAAG
jgi:hypothetical protein